MYNVYDYLHQVEHNLIVWNQRVCLGERYAKQLKKNFIHFIYFLMICIKNEILILGKRRISVNYDWTNLEKIP